MSLKDGDDDTEWSESDLEEYEARLYSMVYHNSNTYDDNEPNSTISATADDNQNVYINHLEKSLNCPTDLENAVKPPNIVHEEFHHSSRNKASRLNRVNEIISIADNIRCRDETAVANRLTNTKDQNIVKKMSFKKQSTNTAIPKTASVYFQNLTKSLNNVQYFQSVEPRLSKSQFLKGQPSSRSSSPHKNASSNSCQTSNAPAALSNFTFSDTCNKAPGVAPVFRLDDRLFPNIPRNTSVEEFELSHRLFSNKPNEVTVDRDRHNHLFNQLPTIPIPSTSSRMEKRLEKKAKRKRRIRARKNAKMLKPSSPVEVTSLDPLQTNADVFVPAILSRLNAVLSQECEGMQRQGDDPVILFKKGTSETLQEAKINSDEIVNLDPGDDEIIILDSDSDSAESIVVITPPSRTPPPIIALEASDEELPTSESKKMHPLLETEHVENSFDFLDSSDETDGLARTQVSLFSNLISNSSSKESLLDDRFFKNRECGLERESAPGPSIPLVHNVTSVVNKLNISNTEPQTQQLQQAAKENTRAKSVVVNLDESSQSVMSVTSISNGAVNSNLDASQDVMVLNVRDETYVDLEINNLVDEAVHNALTGRGEEESEMCFIGKSGKRKRQQLKEDASKVVKRKKRGKKAREKSREQLQEFSQRRTGMEPVMYTKIVGEELLDKNDVQPRNPSHWTREMRHFYNDSWGGENFEVPDVQRTLPVDPALWRVSWEDKRGPVPMQGPYRRSRCYNCSRFGHPSYTCPEPQRVPKCHMCGEKGHREPSCPNKICLQCGRPTQKYSNGCWECQHIPFDLCIKCIWKHDPSTHCFDVRHNPITGDAAGNRATEPSYRRARSTQRHATGNRPSGSKPNPDSAKSPKRNEPRRRASDLRLQLEEKRSLHITRYSDGGQKRGRDATEEAPSYSQVYYKKRKSYDVQHTYKHNGVSSFLVTPRYRGLTQQHQQ